MLCFAALVRCWPLPFWPVLATREFEEIDTLQDESAKRTELQKNNDNPSVLTVKTAPYCNKEKKQSRVAMRDFLNAEFFRCLSFVIVVSASKDH